MTAKQAEDKKALEVVPAEGTAALQKQATDVMSMIERVALNPDLPVERMERLFAFQKEVMGAQAKMDYDAAMARFQALKEVVPHNRQGEGPGGSSYTYSDYPQMTRAIAPWLKEAQLSYSHRKHPPVVDNGKVELVQVDTTISHVGGHSETFPSLAVPDYKLEGKQALDQIIQRSVTYAKRQGLAEGLGLATSEDRDDLDGQTYTELVSDDKAADIQALLDETGADQAAFYNWCSKAFKVTVAGAGDIPAKCADEAISQLERYKARRAKRR